MRTRVFAVCVALATIPAALSARAALLYDASLGTTPASQGWAYVTNPLIGAQSSQSVAGGVLTLDTSPVISEQAGYFSKIPLLSFTHPLNPIMDLNISPYSIQFNMRQVSGSDVPDTDPLAVGQRNRGGFSIIAISEDLSGIELQFQTDQIVALANTNTAFPVGEVQAFDTTDVLHAYNLLLDTGGYQLFADGNVVLQGGLRNYSAIAPAFPNNFPYTTPSFFFFGDNTGRGEAVTQLTRFEVTAVPEPMLSALLLVNLIVFSLRRVPRSPSPGC